MARRGSPPSVLRIGAAPAASRPLSQSWSASGRPAVTSAMATSTDQDVAKETIELTFLIAIHLAPLPRAVVVLRCGHPRQRPAGGRGSRPNARHRRPPPA